MSHSSAIFICGDGTVMYGEYNGTADLMLPAMYPTFEDMVDNWRRQEWGECGDATHAHERVIACADGCDLAWEGQACRACNVFLGPFDPLYIPGALGDADYYAAIDEMGRLYTQYRDADSHDQG